MPAVDEGIHLLREGRVDAGGMDESGDEQAAREDERFHGWDPFRGEKGIV
jgi:hypothetical protein